MLISSGCVVLIIISWIVTISSKSTAEKQLSLITEAMLLMSDGIYIRAVPLLEEAAGYDAVHTETAENELKKAYVALIENRGFSRRYIS